MSTPSWLLSAIEQTGLSRVPMVLNPAIECREQNDSSLNLINTCVVSDVPNVLNVPALSIEDETLIRKWLDRINETDPKMIEYVINESRVDYLASDYSGST